MKKKAQIKFGETFAIIILVYILLMSGMIWYNKVNTKQLNEIKIEDENNQAYEKYYFIVNSQFLHKPTLGDVNEIFDLTSLRIFQNFSNNQENIEFVRRQLEESTITVEVLDKNLKSNENITIYNRTPNIINNVLNFKTLIPIYDDRDEQTYVGKLTVKIYQ